MAEKKDPGKFTIRFNVADPKQRSAAELLNRQGRQKAQFLTAAVLHYINCPETPELAPAPAMDPAELERMVAAVLRRHPEYLSPGGVPATPPSAPEARQETVQTPAPPPSAAFSTAPLPADMEEMLGVAGLAAIAKTIAAFQGE